MIGLLFLAAKLAEQRAGYAGLGTSYGRIRPAKRSSVRTRPSCYPASEEYYDILDNISRGERP